MKPEWLRDLTDEIAGMIKRDEVSDSQIKTYEAVKRLTYLRYITNAQGIEIVRTLMPHLKAFNE